MFVLAQVTMDVEVIARVAAGAERWHGVTNTFIGATLVLLLTVILGKPVCEWALRWWNHNLSPAQARWLGVPTSIGWISAWTGGVLGVYSHVLLDAIMHFDASPWSPMSETNPFVGWLSVEELNFLCLTFLILGTAVFGLANALKRRRLGRESSRRTVLNPTRSGD